MKNTDEYLNNMRHSCAHLLAHAVKLLYPGANNAIGPAIEKGFYQDFDMGNWKVSEADFTKIEAKMREILPTWKSFTYGELTLTEVKKLFADNPYKIEMAEDFAKGGKKLLTNNPGDFPDLCKMGHVDHPNKELKYFKLLSVAGAYWRGDEKNKMLTRIYGTCWPTKDELEKYLWQLEEAKKRDHRKLGKELELFIISEEVGPGLILWLPKGFLLKDTLEQWVKQVEQEWGYERVTTPNITKSGLYYTSGHLPYYKNDMYPPMKLDDGEEYFLKPMNCPHHHMIYKSKPRSYRDLPLRLAEYGTCYRYEASGELFGLMRVRGFSQNDAHIYCTVKQAVDEFVSVMRLHEYFYKKLGINDYHLELSLRDPNNTDKYHGNSAMWQKAEELMRQAVAKLDIPMVEQVGNAAFYGPKIDFIIHSSIGREFAISTNQIDLYMGERFGLKYIDETGHEQTPVIIHRAPLGSHERFIGFLIEHFAGKFPLWLAPTQIIIIPIGEKHKVAATETATILKKAGLRVELDDRTERMQSKIRDATLQKIPYMAIIGDKEITATEPTVSVRMRDGKDLGSQSLKSLLEILSKEIETKR